MRLYIILIIISFLFFAGCTIQKPDSYSCCLKKDAESGNCVFSDQNKVPKFDWSTDSCDLTNGFCLIKNKLTGKGISVPICTERDELSCYDSNCTAMVCGSFKYDPMAAFDTFPSIENDEELSDLKTAKLKQQEEPGLFNKSCWFVPYNKQLGNVFNNNKGGFINSFRLGVGPTFDDYERTRNIFPISDSFCNTNPYGTVDRFENYLPSIQYFLENLHPTSYTQKYLGLPGSKTDYPFDPIESISDPAYCIPYNDNQNLPMFLQTENYNGVSGSYKFSTYTVDVDYQSSGLYEKPKTQYAQIDKQFYSQALPYFYGVDLAQGKKAPFECESGADCKSGTCDTDNYRRGICKAGDQFAQCMCVYDYDKYDYKKQVTRCSAIPKPLYNYDSYNDIKQNPQLLNYDKLMSQNQQILSTPTAKICTTDNQTKFFDANGQNAHQLNLLDLDAFIGLCNADPNCKIASAGFLQENTANPDVTYANFETTICDSIEINSVNSNPGFGQSDLKDYPYKFSSDIIFPDAYLEKLQQIYETSKKQKVKSPIIGYSILDPSSMQLSALVSTCQMQSGIDYETFEVPSLIDTTDTSKDNKIDNIFYPGYSDYCDSGKFQTYELGGGQSLKYCLNYTLGTYSKYVNFVYSLGKCDIDSSNLKPVTKSFGWCEGCAYSTLAYQNVSKTASDYLPKALYKDNHYQSYICASSDYCNPGQSDFKSYDPLPSTYPAVTYIQSKTSEYLKEGVIPVIEASSDGLWEDAENYIDTSLANCVTAASGNTYCSSPSQLKYWINYDQEKQKYIIEKDPSNIKYLFPNKGPVIAIIGRIDISILDPKILTETRSKLIKRAEGLKIYCPQCLVSIVVDSGSNDKYLNHYGGSDIPDRKVADRILLNKLFNIQNDYVDGSPFGFGIDYKPKDITCSTQGTCDPELQKSIDIISFKFYPSELTDSNFCSDSGSDYSVFSKYLIDYGYISLAKYNKPTLVVDFETQNSPDLDLKVTNGETICHAPVSADTLNKYTKKMYDDLFTKRDEIARAGVTGLIVQRDYVGEYFSTYGGVPEDITPTMEYMDNCPLEQSSHLLTSDVPLTFFYRVFAQNPENATCTQCSELDKLLGKCGNLVCANGNQCTLPENSNNNPSDYKCEDRTIPKTCTPCSDPKFADKSAVCKKYYSDGSVDSFSIPMNQLSDSYSDVISSLDTPNRCCLMDKSNNEYTFTKVDASGKKDSPLIFSYSGDENARCGFPSTNDIQNYCGANVPIKNYKIKCDVK